MWRLHAYTVCEWLLYKHLETHLAPYLVSYPRPACNGALAHLIQLN